jgi:hypothetical protein
MSPWNVAAKWQGGYGTLAKEGSSTELPEGAVNLHPANMTMGESVALVQRSAGLGKYALCVAGGRAPKGGARPSPP